jgi:transposase
MAHDLRELARLAKGRNAQPTAAIMDGRTLQSSPESGGRAGYDGYKRRKGSKVHIAVDTLGHLLAVKVTAANEQERAQVGELAAQIQQATGDNVELAYVDQGYTGEAAARQGRSTASDLRWSSSRKPRRALCCCRAAGWWNAALAGRHASSVSLGTTSAWPRL